MRQLFGGHQVATVHDRGIEFQQNIAKLRIGIIVVHVPKNQIAYYRAIRNELRKALAKCPPG